MAEPPEVSFCATNLNTADRLPRSLDSVHSLAQTIGRPYEVVVADGPSVDGARRLLEERSQTDPHLRLVRHTQRRRGYGRRLAYEASSGRMVVPFDTSIVYAPVYGGLLRRFWERDPPWMLFSEICALARSSIEAVGGWRDLTGGEDVDLYARIVDRFGLVAYPLGRPESQSEVLSAVARQRRYVAGSTFSQALQIYRVTRDQIIGANYRVRDLMAFNSAKPWPRRAAYRAFFTLAVLGARLSPIRPYEFAQNNYLLFREAIFRSLLEGRERQLGWEGPPPQLLLTDDEFTYLRRASSVYRQAGPRLEAHLALKGPPGAA